MTWEPEGQEHGFQSRHLPRVETASSRGLQATVWGSLSKHKQAQSIHEPSGAPSKFPLRYILHPTPRILLPSTSPLEHGSEEGKKREKEMKKAKNDSPMGAAIALPEVWKGTGKIIKIVLLYQPVT